MSPLLEIEDLRVSFHTEDGVVGAVDGVSLSVERGRTLGVVGESGAGKSVTGLTVMGLTRGPGTEISGSVRLDGRELTSAPDAELRRVRGRDIAMIFQDPLSSLHPLYTVGRQLEEAVRAHRRVSRSEAQARAVELMALVGIPEAERRLRAHPHELSGGMGQRVMVAMALANEPRLLIADEPTTALDVTVQAQILELLGELQQRLGMAVVLITHDLGVVAEIADDVAVMYAGRVVERAPRSGLFGAPRHPYTWGLLRSIPRLTAARDEPLLPIAGRPPSLIHPPPGCRFHPRCPYVRSHHRRIDPQLEPTGDPGHEVACLLPDPVRRALWSRLAAGATPQQARAIEDRMMGADPGPESGPEPQPEPESEPQPAPGTARP